MIKKTTELWCKIAQQITYGQKLALQGIIFKKSIEKDHHIVLIQETNHTYRFHAYRFLYEYRRMIDKISYYTGVLVWDLLIEDKTYFLFTETGYYFGINEYLKKFNFYTRESCDAVINYFASNITSLFKQDLKVEEYLYWGYLKQFMLNVGASESDFNRLSALPIVQMKNNFLEIVHPYLINFYGEKEVLKRKRDRIKRLNGLKRREENIGRLNFPIRRTDDNSDILNNDNAIDFKNNLLKVCNNLKYYWWRYHLFGLDEKYFSFHAIIFVDCWLDIPNPFCVFKLGDDDLRLKLFYFSKGDFGETQFVIPMNNVYLDFTENYNKQINPFDRIFKYIVNYIETNDMIPDSISELPNVPQTYWEFIKELLME